MNWFFKRRQKNPKGNIKPFYRRQALSFEAIEPRLLLSADAFGGVVDADDVDVSVPLLSNYDKIREDLQAKFLQPHTSSELIDSISINSPDVSQDHQIYDKFDLSSLNGFFSADIQEVPVKTSQLVFIDANTQDMDILLGDALRNPSIQVVTIASDENALSVMTAEIEKYSDLESIHIISHGSSGNLSFGSKTIDLAMLNEYENKELFNRWQGALAEDADLLIYGCNFSEGQLGQDTLSRFAELTGLNTAASDDITGNALFRGDWILEQTIGVVDSEIVVSLDAQQIWQHSLATIVVNSTGDDSLKWGVNSVAQLLNTETEISLREAIQAINSEWGGSGTIHTIEFDLDAGQTINLSSALPSLQRSMIIDGTTEPDYNGAPVVIIDGVTSGNVFTLTASNIEIRGLEISGGQNGIFISGSNNTIENCYIVDNKYYGIDISGASNQIGGDEISERNVISGNGSSGVHIEGGGANNNTLQGNWIGLDVDGETARGNGSDGITLNTSRGTLIGGTAGTSGNVISGNSGIGIEIFRTATALPSNHTILGNIVGLNASGNLAVGNASGIEIYEARYVDVGDGTEAGRNIVSGNVDDGVKIIGENTEFITVSGNYIGTDITGLEAFGNGKDGILVFDGPGAATGYNVGSSWTPDDVSRIYIGGESIEDGNLISGNLGSGIALARDASYVGIVNNIIGLDVNQEGALGNGGHGIWVKIGGGSTSYDTQVFIISNTIANSKYDGIVIEDANTYGVYMSKNLIFNNGDLGIDLGDDGVTVNDTADFDSGANRLFNFPEFSSVSIIDGELNIQGSASYHSNLGSSNVVIEFYYAGSESLGVGANATAYIGSHTVNSSNSTFDVNFDVSIPTGAYITATMTASNVGTSEFSEAIQLGQGNIANIDPNGVVTISGVLLQGALLTASNNITDGNGMSNPVQYQWRRNGIDISGEDNSTYTLQQADVNQSISVVASYIDDDEYIEAVESASSVAISNVNDAVTGTVSISGTRTEDQTLTANYSFIDADGLPAASGFSYQWLVAGVDISGANSQTYTLGDSDVGGSISVRVSYIDLLNSPESMTSTGTLPIANVNDLPVGTISIQGAVTEDQTLTTLLGITDADGLPVDLNYQWYRDGVGIAGADGNAYTLGDDDVGGIIKVAVRYQDDRGASEIVYSAETIEVVNINDAPIGSLDIIGSNVEGQTLTAQNNFTDADGGINSLSYQWYRNGTAITDEVSQQYLIGAADVNQQLSVRAFYLDGMGYDESILSLETNPVNNTNQSPTGSVSIVGWDTATEDQNLTVNINLTDADGLPSVFTYQWYRDNVSIVGADLDNYTLGDDDVGSRITVEVGYIDNLNSHESALSSGTNTVASVNDNPTGSVTITGSNIEGQTVTAQVSLADADGLPAIFAYQWLRDGEEIAGEIALNYELTEQDVGSSLSFRVSYTDLQLYDEVRESSIFGPIANLNQTPDGTVTISGTLSEDNILTAQHGFTDNDGLPIDNIYTYQWFRSGVAIDSAINQQYQLTDNDVDKQISVDVRYIDAHNSEELVQSLAAGPVANVNDSPVGGIFIDGIAKEGQQLTSTLTVIDDDGIDIDLGYQWYRDGVAISGATQAGYLLQNMDIGASISVKWSYQDGHGLVETVTSQPLGGIQNLNSNPTGTVSISGSSVEGQLLTASNNIVDMDGISGVFSYQWYRDGNLIGGAIENTLLLDDIDVASSLQVIVTYIDDEGTTESVASSAVGAVTAINDGFTGGISLSGEAIEDEVLTIVDTVSDNDGLPSLREYVWYRNGAVIDGEITTTLILTDADVGSSIYAQMHYVDGQGFDEWVATTATELVSNVNDLPGGAIEIMGTPAEGQVLSVQNTVTDNDGIMLVNGFQWYRDGIAIGGANQDTYLLQDEDVDAALTVSWQYEDAFGQVETVTSQPLGGIINVNILPTGIVSISGSAEEDQLLVANNTITDADGMSGQVQYQWLRDGGAILGANSSSYRLTATDIDARISVTASYTDNDGTNENVASLATAAVTMVNHIVSGGLMISGDSSVGTHLSVSQTLSDSDGIASELVYQWQRNGEDIPGENTTNYMIRTEDQGSTLSVLVSFTDGRGFEEILVSPFVEIPAQVAVDDPAVIDSLPPQTLESRNTVATDFGGVPKNDIAEDEVEISSLLQDAEREAVEDVTTSAEGIERVVAAPVDKNMATSEQIQDIFGDGDRFSNALESPRNGINLFEFNVASNSKPLSAIELNQSINLVWAPEAVLRSEATIPNLNDLLNILNEPKYNESLEKSVQNLNDDTVTLSHVAIGGTAAASTGLSVGYLLWTLRSGVLMTSLLSSLPAWRFMDPLPILGAENNKTDDDESLESIVESNEKINSDEQGEDRA